MAAQTTPKGMSSRLLTMKFMQRAAATSSPASASSPGTPAPDESSSKRRKISHSRPSQPEVDVLVDRQKIQLAIAEDERKREDAIVKRAAELGDARWVLDVPALSNSDAAAAKPLQVVQVGYAQIDSSNRLDDSDSTDEAQERVPIRRYNMAKKKTAAVASDSESDSGDSSDDSDSSDGRSSADEGGTRSRAHSTNRSSSTPRGGYSSKRSAEKERAKEFADKRRKKEVKLNHKPQSAGPPSTSKGGGMLSLSSGGRPMPRQSGAFSFNCHNCGQTGHKAADCKKPRNRAH